MKNRNITQKIEAAALAVTAQIARQILVIRGQKVMLDADLATHYDVPTKRLNQQVKRNAERFPEDFMFQLDRAERDEVVANCDHLRQLKYSPTTRQFSRTRSSRPPAPLARPWGSRSQNPLAE